MASTLKLQDIVNSAKAYADLVPVLGKGGWEQEPALTIANDVMQRYLSSNMNWKFNRAKPLSILTVALQQDYVTNITNLGWLEQGWRIDINNTINPKPAFAMEAVRDLALTSYQANPFNVSWIPNPIANFGMWKANTNYYGSYSVAQTPMSPIQQFVDANGNILFIDSSVLKLNLNSPGWAFNGIPSTLPSTTTPFGTSGSVQPILPPNTAPGTTVNDGGANGVTWTVTDPNAIAIRLAPLPATSGIPWLVVPVYQLKPPILKTLAQTIAPIPDEYGYLFRMGFMAMCRDHAAPGSKQAAESYQKWEEMLIVALRGADREREEAGLYPSESLMGGGPYKYGMPIGPAWPFNYWGQ